MRTFIAVKHRISSLVIVALAVAGCGAPADSNPAGSDSPSVTPDAPPPAAGAITRLAASSNLDTTPVSAADYAMYAAIMGGASAMLSTLSTADRTALEFAKRVDAGTVSVTPETQSFLTQARALQRKDEDLARLQGVDARYLQVKAKIDAVIGPTAKPVTADDAVGTENRRYLEPHRDNIERLQRILRDQLAKRAEPK